MPMQGDDFEISRNAPIKESANVFEGVRSLTPAFNSVQYVEDVLVGDLIKQLRPWEVPREVPRKLVGRSRPKMGNMERVKFGKGLGIRGHDGCFRC